LSLVHSTITGTVAFKNDGMHGNDLIANNTFNSLSGSILSINSSLGTVVKANIFLPGSDTQDVIFVANAGNATLPVTIANNTITLINGGGPATTGIDVSAVPGNVRILSNTIATNNLGAAVTLEMYPGLSALVDGNDFHNNAVGVAIRGNVGLGAGNCLLQFNDFRSFVSGADTTHGAIVFTQATSGTVVAPHNMFDDDTSPASVVFAPPGTAVDVSQPLTSDQSFVEGIYIEVLGRRGNLDELNFWVQLLREQGQAAVVNAILKSQEALGRIVDSFYLQFLGRGADQGGRDGWIRFLQNGGTEEQVETLFLTSQEYLSRIDTIFVQSLYLNILGRPGSAGELAGWNNNIPSLGLAGIATAFVHSVEYRSNIVRSYFQAFRHRTPSNGELMLLVNSSQDLLSLEATLLSPPD
jgi:hypothetical protein